MKTGGLLASQLSKVCLIYPMNSSRFLSVSLLGSSQTVGKVFTMIYALLMASFGVQTRMASNRYRFNSAPIASSRRSLSAKMPCQLRKLRKSFRPLQN